MSKIIYVWFEHDIEDGWFEATFPNSNLNGSYGRSSSISKIAKDNGWKIIWRGDDQYNPWK